jgi:methionyl-tRNA formyltransferase
MKIILCGFHWIGCKALVELISKKNQLFVYTHEAPYHINDLAALCVEKKVPFSTEPIQLNNLPFKADIILSLYYRHIIGKEVIDSCDGKIINLHPSLLPKYKGCSSLTWAMIHNEKQAGFTFHYLTEKVDSGNILYQKKIRIEEFDTQITLYHRIMFEASKQLNKIIKMVIQGIAGQPQEHLSGHYFKRGCPHNGIIGEHWNPDEVKRFIRSMIYPPLPVAVFRNHSIHSYQEYLETLQANLDTN